MEGQHDGVTAFFQASGAWGRGLEQELVGAIRSQEQEVARVKRRAPTDNLGIKTKHHIHSLTHVCECCVTVSPSNLDQPSPIRHLRLQLVTAPPSHTHTSLPPWFPSSVRSVFCGGLWSKPPGAMASYYCAIAAAKSFPHQCQWAVMEGLADADWELESETGGRLPVAPWVGS